MSGRFLSPVDISAARHEMEVINSLLKRGQVKRSEDILRMHHVVCGCGAPGCIFISIMRKELDDKESAMDKLVKDFNSFKKTNPTGNYF